MVSEHALMNYVTPIRDNNANEVSVTDATTSHEEVILERNEKTNDPNLYYDMSGEKMMFIFNHYKFKNTRDYTLSPREGTKQDVNSLQNTFGNFGFNVEVCEDFTREEIFNKLDNICAMDHTNTSCVSIVILTHGNVGGMVCAFDMAYMVDSVIGYLASEPKLFGKPKLFFIQACRGGDTDSGLQISTDGDSSFTFPSHSDDCFIMKATFEGFVSFRSSSGSKMIQALCAVMNENHSQNIMSISTQVSFRVAQQTSFSPAVPRYHEKKQAVTNYSTLNKFLYFKMEDKLDVAEQEEISAQKVEHDLDKVTRNPLAFEWSKFKVKKCIIL